jgi:hypothetical protein
LIALAVFISMSEGCKSAPPPPGRDYYFSPRGSDSAGTGLLDQPYCSIAKANRLMLNPGDRLLFEGGATFHGNLALDDDDAGTAEKPITISSFGQGRATIQAGVGTGIRVENAGGVCIAYLTVVATGPRSNTGDGIEFLNSMRGGKKLKSVRIENVEARGFGKEGIVLRGAPRDGSPSGFDDVRIVDCVTRQNGHCGIYLAGHCRVEPGQPPDVYAHANVRVARCLAEDNPGDPTARGENRSGSGILLDSVDNGVIEYCEATGNGALNRSRQGGPIGIWCTLSNRIAIQYCKSHRNQTGGDHDGGGFGLDGGVRSSVLQYNLSESNDGSGFGLYQYPGAPPAAANTIRFNISRNDGRKNGYAGIHVWDDARNLRDVRIHDNQVQLAAVSNGKPPRGLWLQSRIRDALISRNVFKVDPGVRLMDVAAGQWQVRLEENTYHTAGDAFAVGWVGWEYSSLSAWLQATGQRAVLMSKD